MQLLIFAAVAIVVGIVASRRFPRLRALIVRKGSYTTKDIEEDKRSFEQRCADIEAELYATAAPQIELLKRLLDRQTATRKTLESFYKEFEAARTSAALSSIDKVSKYSELKVRIEYAEKEIKRRDGKIREVIEELRETEYNKVWGEFDNLEEFGY